MLGHRIVAALAVGAILATAACTPVEEPWDKTGYFEAYRSQPAGLDKRLRDRLSHTQGDQARSG